MAEGGVPLAPGTDFFVEVPRQTIVTAPAEVNLETTARIALYVLILSFVLKFVLQSILNSLISMIRAMTLMAHMMLIDMWYPSNVQQFFS